MGVDSHGNQLWPQILVWSLCPKNLVRRRALYGKILVRKIPGDARQVRLSLLENLNRHAEVC